MSVGRSVLSATWPAQILGRRIPAHRRRIGPGQALRCRMHTQPIAFVGFQNFHDLPVRLLHGPSGGRLCCLTSHRANPVDLEWDRRELAGPVQMKEDQLSAEREPSRPLQGSWRVRCQSGPLHYPAWVVRGSARLPPCKCSMLNANACTSNVITKGTSLPL